MAGWSVFRLRAALQPSAPRADPPPGEDADHRSARRHLARRPARARDRLRRSGALLFGAGAVTLAAVLTAPDPDPSNHRSLLICSAVFALAAASLAVWRGVPELVLHLVCPLGTVATAVATGLAEPVGLTPIFFLLPMLVAGNFLPRNEIAANYAFALLAAVSRSPSGLSPAYASPCSWPSR